MCLLTFGSILHSLNAVWPVVTALSATGGQIIAELGQLGRGSYYWRLPQQFLGNKLTAYGGYERHHSLHL